MLENDLRRLQDWLEETPTDPGPPLMPEMAVTDGEIEEYAERAGRLFGWCAKCGAEEGCACRS